MGDKSKHLVANIEQMLKAGWEPHEFWGYTTVVTDRIFQRYGNGWDAPEGYGVLRNKLLKAFNAAGIKAQSDNKIAFGFKKGDKMLYVGFYDWHIDVGHGIRPDDWLKPSRKL